VFRISGSCDKQVGTGRPASPVIWRRNVREYNGLQLIIAGSIPFLRIPAYLAILSVKREATWTGG